LRSEPIVQRREIRFSKTRPELAVEDELPHARFRTKRLRRRSACATNRSGAADRVIDQVRDLTKALQLLVRELSLLAGSIQVDRAGISVEHRRRQRRGGGVLQAVGGEEFAHEARRFVLPGLPAIGGAHRRAARDGGPCRAIECVKIFRVALEQRLGHVCRLRDLERAARERSNHDTVRVGDEPPDQLEKL
jgi:hypothetical protein